MCPWSLSHLLPANLASHSSHWLRSSPSCLNIPLPLHGILALPWWGPCRLLSLTLNWGHLGVKVSSKQSSGFLCYLTVTPYLVGVQLRWASGNLRGSTLTSLFPLMPPPLGTNPSKGQLGNNMSSCCFSHLGFPLFSSGERERNRTCLNALLPLYSS